MAALICAGGTALAVILMNLPGGDSLGRARELVLRQDLYDMRAMLKEYTTDQHKRPRSLQELVASRYLMNVPVDPLTGRDDTWVLDRSADPESPGVVNIHSGSHSTSSKGDHYSEW